MAPSTVLETVSYSHVKDTESLPDLDDMSSVASSMTPEKGSMVTSTSSIRQSLSGNENINKKRRHDTDDSSPMVKRRRVVEPSKEVTLTNQSPMSVIINAVDKMSTDCDLVADASRENVLPTISGKHSDLNAISLETLSDVINGCYNKSIDHVTIIDCRYPYEYNGGHTQYALNLYTKDMIHKFLHETTSSSSRVHELIFHCEFSSKRGPQMYRFLRSLDRDLNKDCYPKLNFPEIYLLEGGYKAFNETNKIECEPQSYLPMFHKDHGTDLRHFRVKSKSWTAGEKPRKEIRSRGCGLKLSF